MLTLMGHSQILQQLLGLFFSNPASKYYLREIERLTKKPVGSLQRHLAQLEKEGVLKSWKEGPLKYFSLNLEYPYFSELKSVVLRELRRKELQKNLQKILKSLKEKYRPEKVILFGSLARGWVSPESDLDLLIIKHDVPKRYWDRVKELAPLLSNSDVGVDYVIWTPQELAEGIGTNLFLKKEMLSKGKVVYERAA